MTSVPSNPPPGPAPASAPLPAREAVVPLRRHDDPARTAVIPPLAVEQALLDAIVACCRPGESVPEFVEGALRASLRRRTAQAEFVARRAAALDLARRASVAGDAGH
jgi:hypothetical protein